MFKVRVGHPSLVELVHQVEEVERLYSLVVERIFGLGIEIADFVDHDLKLEKGLVG
ncbi:hypothetical protein D3C83_264100 [compost metagenome]